MQDVRPRGVEGVLRIVLDRTPDGGVEQPNLEDRWQRHPTVRVEPMQVHVGENELGRLTDPPSHVVFQAVRKPQRARPHRRRVGGDERRRQQQQRDDRSVLDEQLRCSGKFLCVEDRQRHFLVYPIDQLLRSDGVNRDISHCLL